MPVGVLSGGLDSTSIAAVANKYQSNIKTISSVSKDKNFSEKKYIDNLVNKNNLNLLLKRYLNIENKISFNDAQYEFTNKYPGLNSQYQKYQFHQYQKIKILVKKYIDNLVNKNNLNHEYIDPVEEPFFDTLEKIIKYHDQPICTSTWYSMYLLCKNISNIGIKVVLTGHGGDELLAGYWDHYLYNFYDLNKYKKKLNNEISKWKTNHNRNFDEYKSIDSTLTKLENDKFYEEKKYINYNDILNKKIIEKK